MSHPTSRSALRFFSLPLVAALSLLAACGSSSVHDPFVPTRMVSFGDGLSDVGKVSGKRYTVNDATANPTWAETVASNYGLTLTASTAGGKAYGAGNATLTDVAAQVTVFKAGNSFASGDLVLLSAGLRDLVNVMRNVAAGSVTTASASSQAKQLGRDYANLIIDLVASGAKHVGVINAYDLAKSAYAQAAGQTGLTITRDFNDALKATLGNSTQSGLGDSVRLVDIEYYTNLMFGAPGSYSLTDSTTVVCNGASIDTADGIGIGTNEANASLCTTSTVSTTSYDSYFFADKIHPTPSVHRQIGGYVAGILKARW